jgi:hypothetical protein
VGGGAVGYLMQLPTCLQRVERADSSLGLWGLSAITPFGLVRVSGLGCMYSSCFGLVLAAPFWAVASALQSHVDHVCAFGYERARPYIRKTQVNDT